MQVFVWRPERNFLERVFSFQSIESGSLIISAITQDSRALKSALSSLFCLHLKYFNRTLELWPHSAFWGFQELDLGPQECAEGILTHGVLLPTPPKGIMSHFSPQLSVCVDLGAQMRALSLKLSSSHNSNMLKQLYRQFRVPSTALILTPLLPCCLCANMLSIW